MALNAVSQTPSNQATVVDRLALQKPAPMRMVHLYPPFDRYMAAVPAEVLQTPSMMSENERTFLYNIVQRYYTGVGRVLDAGIFLGGSTNCFTAAIRKNPRFDKIVAKWPKPVLSLERAIVSNTMPAFFSRHGIGLDYEAGESFAPLLERYVGPCKDLVELRIGDILECGDINDRIEICFLDVLKNPQIAAYAVKQYFPKLIPGRSIVIQQDYFFEGLPFIKTYQEFFANQFEYIGEVGSSAIFRCAARIDKSEIDKVVAGLPSDKQLRLASIAMQRSIDPTRRLMMAMSKTQLIRDLEGVEKARAYLAFVEDEFAGEIGGALPPRVAEPLAALRARCTTTSAPEDEGPSARETNAKRSAAGTGEQPKAAGRHSS